MEARWSLARCLLLLGWQVSWDDAHIQLNKIDMDNNKGMWLYTLPYKLGIATSVSAAFISIPMVFDLDTALW